MLAMGIFQVSLLLSSFLDMSMAMKVLSFTSSSSLSYSTLAGGMSRELPEQFTLCVSHKQARVDNRGAFQILGADGRPWLALQFFIPPRTRFATEFEVWGFVPGSEHVLLGTSGQLKLNEWIQTGVKLDTRQNGHVSVNVDGKTMETNTNLNSNRPKGLIQTLWLGVSTTLPEYKETQFHGLVSNVRVFSSVDLWPSCGDSGDLLQWNTEHWMTNSSVIKESEENVCSKNATYPLAIPFRLPQDEAKRTCSKLAHGKMVGPRNLEELEKFIQWVYPLLGHLRNFTWTPFTLRL